MKWLIGLMIGCVAATFALDADAQRRLGGGKNLGKPSQQMQQRQATPPPAQQQAAPGQPSQAANPAVAGAGATAAAGRAASPWRGALVGLAAGLGLMALASWLGFGEGLATVMLIALIGLAIALAVGALLRRARGARPAYGAAGGGEVPLGYETQPAPRPQPLERRAQLPAAGARPGSAMDEFARGAAAAPVPAVIPAGFDVDGFFSHARAHFDRLQQAWDRGSLDELADFTTHDMFVALTHELRGRPRGAEDGPAVVEALEATLLGVHSDEREHLASVRFTGRLRTGAQVEAFDEVWNLVKPVDGSTGWLLAGIQQLDA